MFSRISTANRSLAARLVLAVVLLSAWLESPAAVGAQVPLNPIITGDLKVFTVEVVNRRVVNGVPLGDVVIRNPASPLWYGITVNQNATAENVPSPIPSTVL